MSFLVPGLDLTSPPLVSYPLSLSLTFTDVEGYFLLSLSSLLALESVVIHVFGEQQPRPSLWTITAH